VIEFARNWGLVVDFLANSGLRFPGNLKLCFSLLGGRAEGFRCGQGERRESGEQDLFRSRLDQVINMNHALVKLARAIDWRFLEEKFSAIYKDGPGQPPATDPADGGACDPQAHLQPQRRGGV